MKQYNNVSINDLIQLAAPHTWVSSIIPAVFAIVLAGILGLGLKAWQSMLLLLTSILMQASVNTFNDYSDFVNGVDSMEDTNLSKNDSAIVFNNLNPKSVLKVAISYLILGGSLGLLSLDDYKLVPITIGIIGALIVLSYSCGPVKLSYLPLGEIVSGFVMGGMIPMGILSVADGKIHWKVLLYGLSIIIGIGLIMMTNNACDIKKDRKANRKTLAVLLGIEKIRKTYRFLIITCLILIMTFSIKFMSFIGFFIVLVSFLLNKNLIKSLLNAKFLSKDRIYYMKSIVKFNALINGTYVLILFLSYLGL